MKKKLLFMMTALLLPMLASASDIQVANDDGVTICYNYINNGKELEVIKVDFHYSVVNIPDSVTFMGRTRNVTSIGKGAFISCNLTSVTIPNSVTSIGGWAFGDCSSLTSITLPNSVISISGQAFYNCNFTIVNSLITEPFDIFENAFSQNTLYNATLKVPAGTIDKYKATNGWKMFQFIEEISDDSSKPLE